MILHDIANSYFKCRDHGISCPISGRKVVPNPSYDEPLCRTLCRTLFFYVFFSMILIICPSSYFKCKNHVISWPKINIIWVSNPTQGSALGLAQRRVRHSNDIEFWSWYHMILTFKITTWVYYQYHVEKTPKNRVRHRVRHCVEPCAEPCFFMFFQHDIDSIPK